MEEARASLFEGGKNHASERRYDFRPGVTVRRRPRAEVNARADDGATALMPAAEKGHTATVDLPKGLMARN